MKHSLKQEFYTLLKKEEYYFDFIQNQALDGFWYMNLHNFDEVYISPKFCALMGFDAQQVIRENKHWRDCLLKEDYQFLQKTLKDALCEGNHQFQLTLRFKHKGKSQIWLNSFGEFIKTDSECYSHVLIGFKDLNWENPEQSSAFLKEQLEDFFSLTEELFCIANTEGYFLEINQAWENTLGYSLKDLTSNQFLDFIHPEDLDNTLKVLEQLKDGQVVKNFVNRYKSKKGTYVVLEWQAFPKGKLIYNVARDITQRLAVQKQLQENEAMLTNLTNSLPGLIFKYQVLPDGSNAILFVNQGVQKVYGVSVEEVLKDSSVIWNKVHPEDAPEVQSKVVASMQSMSVWECEWRIVVAEQVKWMMGRGVPRKQEDGSVIWDSLILEITAQKELEQQINTQNAILRGIIESAKDPIFSIDKEYRYTTFNQAHKEYTQKLFGYDIELGQNSLNYVDSTKLSGFLKFNLDRVLSGESIVIETLAGKKGKENRFLEIIQNPIRDEQGDIQGAAFFALDITEEKNIKDQLVANEERFRALVENSRNIFMLCNEHSVHYISPNVTEVLGYSTEEFINLHFHSLMHPDDLPFSWELLATSHAELSLDVRLKHKNGDWRYFNAFAKNLQDNTQINGFVFNLLDITPRKLAEKFAHQKHQALLASEKQLKNSQEALTLNLEKLKVAQKHLKTQKVALQISEEKYRKVVETQNDLISLSLADSTIIFVNEPLCKAYGTSRQELVGKKWADFYEKEKAYEHLNKIAELSPEKDTYIMETYNQHADGEYHWVQWVDRGVFDSNGALIQVHTVGRDITELKKAQEALKSSEKEALLLAKNYKSILDSQAVYVVKTDALGNYTDTNQYFNDIFGKHLIGKSLMESIIPEDHHKCYETVQKCIHQPGQSVEVILRKLTPEKQLKGAKWEFTGIVNEQGEVSEVLCIGYDITEQLTSLERLKKLLDITSDQNNRLQNFAYIISHNIRSHSANMTSLVDFIKTVDTPEEKQLYLDLLDQSAKKLDETITNLNEVISIHRNFNKPKELRNLNLQICKTLEVLSGFILEKHIQVSNKVDKNMVINVIPTYLDSILLNVLSNAVKYYDPQKSSPFIKIKAKHEAPYIVLSIKDNGLGIDTVKNAKKLFGMYKTFHTNEDARGLGLFITKNQIEAMGGKIDVESQEGLGSTFNLYFHE